MSGARPITNSSRTDCRASTNGRSTCGVELAMMAIESRPPGLVARYAVKCVGPGKFDEALCQCRTKSHQVSAATMTTGMERPAWTSASRLKPKPMGHPKQAYAAASSQRGRSI